MKTQAVRKVSMWAKRGFQPWTFFAVLLVVLVCSAVVGTQSVHASGTCTVLQCGQARTYARNTCAIHGGLLGFSCPLSGETDDFFLTCNDTWTEWDDCGTFAPS